MQLLPIVLIGVLLAADGGLAAPDAGPRGGAAVAAALGPIAAVLAAAFVGVVVCTRRLERTRSATWITAAERVVRSARWLLVVHFAAGVLLFGWLDVVRDAVGDLVLADEVVAILPTALGIAATWWIYYPVERRVRDAVLIRQLDLGRGIFPNPTRGEYVLTQTRLHLLFLLVPILLILAAAELIDAAVGRWSDVWWASWAGEAATLAVAGLVVLVAPLLSRVVLEVEPMPEGPVRDDLLRICRTHQVRVRELLVWRTHGSMVNAAVMGLVGGLRYVLLTDALLEAMTRRQLEAVMAHEIAHVRRHHLPWLLLSLLAAVILVGAPVTLAQAGLESAGAAAWVTGAAGGVLLAAAVGVLGVFGWISRRFERQADAFAVRHLNGTGPGGDERISPEAAAMMSSALETIGRLNAVGDDRRSWRHGSITWRRAYLESIVGRPAGALAIDRQVMWIKLAAAGVLVAALAYGLVSLRAGGRLTAPPEQTARAPGPRLPLASCASPRCTAPATTSSVSTRSASPSWRRAGTWTPSPASSATGARGSAATASS